MNIRLKTLAINSLAVASVLSVIYLVSAPLIMQGFEKVEQKDAIQNVGRATDAIQNELESQSSKLRDWASWDDSYNFATAKNPTFITENFGDDPNYPSLIYDIIMYYTSSGKLFYSNGEISPPQDLLDKLTPDNPLLQNGNKEIEDADNADINGIVSLKDGPALISSRPILHVDDSGPTGGSLIFVRYLDKDYAKKIADFTRLNLGLYTVEDPNMPADVKAVKDSLQVGKTITNVQDSSRINGYTILNNLYGKPILVVKVSLARDIYHQGRSSLRLFLFLLLIAGAAFILFTAILLDRLVIRRITLLTGDVEEIKDQTAIKDTLRFRGNDEVARLATSINHMLERISSSNKQVHTLVDQLKHEKEGVEKQVKQRTSQLEDEKSRFLASIRSLPLGFILTDSQSRILMLNPSIKKFLKLDGDNAELINKLAAENDSLLHKLMDLSRSVTHSKKIESLELTHDEGRSFHAFAAPVLMRDGECNGAVVLLEDITEAKILERSKEEFFSIASHELRTPLTAIRGNTSLMQQMYEDQLKDPGLNDMVEDIHASSVRLIDIVNDFLDASSLELGKMKFSEENFDINPIIEKVVEEMGGYIKEKGLKIHYEKPQTPLPMIRADANRMKQVIYNLIGNAVKFTDEGSVTIKTELSPVQHMLRMTVTDTGSGISPEGQQILFHKFQQSGNSLHTRDATKGTGLGLYISKLIVEHFGGHIQLDSSQEGEDHGSSFSLTIPLAK